MSFLDMAHSLFPNLHATGGSHIHVSHAAQGIVTIPFSQPRLILSSMIKHNFPGTIERAAIHNFSHMEWVMQGYEFHDLMLVEAHRFLHSQPSVATKGKLQNPKTGNQFHRIALMEEKELVLGCRIWINDHDDCTVVGFRLRLESLHAHSDGNGLSGKAQSIREKAVELVLALELEMVEIKEFVSKETSGKEVNFEQCFNAGN